MKLPTIEKAVEMLRKFLTAANNHDHFGVDWNRKENGTPYLKIENPVGATEHLKFVPRHYFGFDVIDPLQDKEEV